MGAKPLSRGEVDLASMIRAAAPDLPPERIVAIAHRITLDLGGGRVYFRKAPAEHKAEALGAALARGLSVQEAFVVAGVSQTHGYRLLRRRQFVRDY